MELLLEALEIVRRILAGSSDYPALQRTQKQLEAMQKWTANGREPSERERRSIDVGLVAAREFDGERGELGQLAQKLFALNNYFEAWPTDEEAATATDDDFFEEDD